MADDPSHSALILPLGSGLPEKEAQAGAQLDLFLRPRIVRLPGRLSPFQEALLLDERGSGEARNAYLRAIEAGDNPADACCNLGILSSEEGETESAISWFTDALRYDPGHAESHYNLGNLYLKEGWLRPAELHYQLAIASDREMASAYYNLGLARAMQKKIPDAIAALEAYVERAAHAADGAGNRLLSYLRQISRDMR